MSQPARIITIVLGTLVGIALLGALALHVSREALVRKALELARDELAQDAVFIDWTVEPIPGGPGVSLRLRDVTIHQDSTRTAAQASLSSLDLRVHFWKSLLSQAPQVDLGTTDATLAFPVEGTEQTVTGLGLQASLTPGVMELAKGAALSQGIRLRFSGRADLPEKTPKPRKAAAPDVQIPETQEVVPSRLNLTGLALLSGGADYTGAGFSPELTSVFSVKGGPEGTWEVAVEWEALSFPSEGKQLTASVDLHLPAKGPAEVRSLVIRDGETTAEGSGQLAEDGSAFELASFRSNLDWVSILRDWPALEGGLAPCTLTRVPEIELSGSWSLEDPVLSQLSGRITGLDGSWTQDAPDGQPAPAPITLAAAQASVSLAEGRLQIADGSATAVGGPIRFTFSNLPFAPEPLPWSLSLDGGDLSLAAIGALLGEEAPEGKVSLSFVGTGGNKPARLNGSGSLRIETREPLQIRMVGPLIDLLSSLAPMFGDTGADRLQGTFTVQDGILSTGDLVIGVSAAEVRAAGTINLTTEETSFTANANLRGALGQLAASFSDALAIEGSGPLDNVQWRFKNLQRASSLTELLKAAQGLPQGVIPPAGTTTPPEAPPGATPDVLKSVEKIGDLLKELNDAANPKPAPRPEN